MGGALRRRGGRRPGWEEPRGSLAVTGQRQALIKPAHTTPGVGDQASSPCGPVGGSCLTCRGPTLLIKSHPKDDLGALLCCPEGQGEAAHKRLLRKVNNSAVGGVGFWQRHPGPRKLRAYPQPQPGVGGKLSPAIRLSVAVRIPPGSSIINVGRGLQVGANWGSSGCPGFHLSGTQKQAYPERGWLSTWGQRGACPPCTEGAGQGLEG